MKTVTTIGIDLAKNSFSIYGVNAMGKPVLSRTLSRAGVVRFFANLPAALWAWRLARLRSTGPEPLKASAMRCDAFIPRYVKAYLLGAKNDANDAAAICEAVQRPNMRFVPHKSPEQTDIQCIHRIRQGYVKSRTALVNRTIPIQYSFFLTARLLIDQGATCAFHKRIAADWLTDHCRG